MITCDWLRETLTRADLLRDARCDGAATFRGACQDTRRLRAGQLFVALPGENTRGDRFAGKALALGAAAVMLSDAPTFTKLRETTDAALFLTDDPLAALQALAARRLREVAPRVVAITGSNGKTTTKEICRRLVATIGPTFASEGNYNNTLGLPLTVLDMPGDTRFLVLEMGCSSFGEIARLCELFPPEIGIVTNIGAAHLEVLGDLDGVARAKGELPAALPADGLLLLPADEPYRARLAALSRAPRRFFAVDADADVTARDLGPRGAGARGFAVGELEGELPLPTRHALSGLAAAWAAALHLGGDPARFAAALTRLDGAGDRGVVYELGEWLIMDDSYNANPASMRSALDWLAARETSGGRWAALGDMLELGERSGELHAELGREIARLGLSGLLTCGREMALTARAAADAGMRRARHFATHADLAAALAETLRAGDVLLVKGSRGAAMERVITALETLAGRQRKVPD